ncbi:putative MFS allantoate transporter [Aureobasidium subglaciale]|nr:putative MFS allantoate transporter [Aureobasidium subglaciale]KAI5271682.1 putative MFS allantoate transporter [Aureobasidium subglaciale]
MPDTEKSTLPFDAEKELPGPLADAIRNGSVDKNILQHAGDADEALKAFMSHPGEVIELDEATNKRLLRRIDLHLMPVMCIVYGLNYLDKTTLSYASVMGLKKDTNLQGLDYQWLSSMFYFGYIFWEYPTNRLLQRLPLGKYSAANIILWGTTLCTFAAVKDFGGGVAVRFFLGVTEAAVTPGFALLTSQWYTKKEQGSRTSIWFSFNGFAQIFGGLVAYGIAKGTRLHGSAIEPWKIIFLVTGCLTICVGFIFLYVIPDSQLNARFLSKEDRVLAIERVRCNQQGIGNKHFKMYQLKEALLDPLTWAFFFYALVADIPNGGISNFFSQLITSFGYTAEESLLYGTPGGAIEVIALLLCGYLGDKFGNRLLISTSGLWISTLGMLLIVCLPLDNNIGRLFGYYLTQASPTPFVALLSLISTNVAGWTKKTTVAALYLIGYCAGNIIGPQTFRPKDAPRYIPAEIVIIVCWMLCIADIVFIYWYCKRQNRKRAEIRASPAYVKLENQEWLDLTDRENPEFVYTL